jgi:MFS family permease
MGVKGRDSELRNAIRVSVVEGVYTQVYIALATAGSVFVTRFALLLGALPYHLGLLAAIGQLSLVFQPFGFALTRRGTSRKSTIIRLATAGLVLALLYGILPFLFPEYVAIWIFLLLLSISTSLHAMGTNAWIAWISDMVPERVRGRFFSWRSRYFMMVGLLLGYLLGAIVDLYDPHTVGVVEKLLKLRNTGLFSSEYLNVTFIIIFGIATIFGFLGVVFLRRQPERQKQIESRSFLQTFKDSLHDTNFRRFLIYNSWWMLALGVGAPFWQPFMIQKLHMSLVSIQIYGTISAISAILALRPWGLVIDRFGNKTAMRVAITLGGINPLVWIFVNAHTSWILYLEAITSGIMWSGANIMAMNFVLAIAPQDKRQVYSGVLGAFSGSAMIITMLLSGFLLPRGLIVLGFYLEPEQVLFGTTGILRWTAHIPLGWVQEARAQPLGALFYYFRQFTKVRIAQLVGLITRNAAQNSTRR